MKGYRIKMAGFSAALIHLLLPARTACRSSPVITDHRST
ncbi:hypothetical protein RSAG8_10576, partial [Rhizoctonia solani AG-8 WAC10335]